MTSAPKAAVTPLFPSQIIGGPAIDVERQDNNWNVALDFTELPSVSPYTAQSNHYVVVWDAVANHYFLVPSTSL